MVAPRKTVWKIEPRTQTKHEILRRYLEAWTAILSLGKFPAFAYVDGFAGPGVYEDGEIGSPIIALNAAMEQQRRHREMERNRLLFLFVEQNQDRADRLQETVDALLLPANFSVKVVAATSCGPCFQGQYFALVEESSEPVDPLWFVRLQPGGLITDSPR